MSAHRLELAACALAIVAYALLLACALDWFDRSSRPVADPDALPPTAPPMVAGAGGSVRTGHRCRCTLIPVDDLDWRWPDA